jgi:hypothetical protein
MRQLRRCSGPWYLPLVCKTLVEAISNLQVSLLNLGTPCYPLIWIILGDIRWEKSINLERFLFSLFLNIVILQLML